MSFSSNFPVTHAHRSETGDGTDDSMRLSCAEPRTSHLFVTADPISKSTIGGSGRVTHRPLAQDLAALSGRVCPPTAHGFLRRLMEYATAAGYLTPKPTK